MGLRPTKLLARQDLLHSFSLGNAAMRNYHGTRDEISTDNTSTSDFILDFPA